MLLFVKRNTPIDKKEQTFVAKRIFLWEELQPLLNGESILIAQECMKRNK